MLLAPVTASAGQVIDGVIATINHKPVLQSDWDDAVRFEAFLQQKPLGSVTQADRVRMHSGTPSAQPRAWNAGHHC